MWTFNTDSNKWVATQDKISKDNFDYLKQELKSTRLYSKCLSGATYIPINRLDNIYDILTEWKPRNWFVSTDGSPYSITDIPNFSSKVNAISSFDYYTKFTSEYGLTLKNLFTPDRLIKDSLKNFLYVDLATTEQISNLGATFNDLFIDGVRVLDGHRILVKDQITVESLAFDVDPNTYFAGPYTLVQDYGATIEYSYYNSDNGIYTFNNKKLIKTDDLSDYADCIRYSVSVKLGNSNREKQFHMSRLLNGYYPTTSLNEPIEFKEKQNWILRHKVDYNNLFEINYYDIVKYEAMQYNLDGVTYSIPERLISIGEFGVILNTQGGISNIIPNKYKENLRSIASTTKYYWICGDNGLLLKIRKHDFRIEKVETGVTTNLKSVSFYDDLNGVIVGELNTILITNDETTIESLIVDDFDSFNYNKVIFYDLNRVFICGNNGVFLELQEDISGWDVYKRRISRYIDDYEEYLLVDDINDMSIYKTSTWGLSFSYSTQSTTNDKEFLLLAANDKKIILHDLNDCIPNFDFIYLDITNEGDIKNISVIDDKIYLNIDSADSSSGIYYVDTIQYQYIGVNNSYSNTLFGEVNAISITVNYNNTDYNSFNAFGFYNNDLTVCGNESLLLEGVLSTLSTRDNYVFNIPDSTLVDRLKSKLLFVDYDIAGKLNFFTDAGEYRLPNSVIINNSTNSASVSTFTNSTPITLMSYTTMTSDFYISQVNVPAYISIGINLNSTQLNKLVINLKAPNGKIINLKSDGTGFGSTFSNTSFSSKDILSPLSNSLATNHNNITYRMQKDINRGATGWLSNVIDFSSFISGMNSMEGNWTLYIRSIEPIILDPFEALSRPPIFRPIPTNIGTLNNWSITFGYDIESVNLIESSNGYPISKLWFEPLTYGATAPSFMTQSETNWLTYWKDTEKTFPYYDTVMPFDESRTVLISTTFSYSLVRDSYSISNTSVTNDINIISPLAPSLLDNEDSKFDGQTLTPISATYSNILHQMYLYDYLMILRVDTNYPVEVGEVIRLESDVIDGNFVVNRIENILVAPQGPLIRFIPRRYKFLYLFTNFNDNIIQNLVETTSAITISNLNRYRNISELANNFNKHPISNAYQMSIIPNTNDIFSRNAGNTNIEIKPLFNNLTSYYNLATNVLVEDSVSITTFTMSYTSGFLNFGYTPTYNILNYLEAIDDVNNPKFLATKEYLAMPIYEGLPANNGGGFLSDQVYIKYNDNRTNQIYFGLDRELEWESIFLNTFIDITIYQSGNQYSTERLLVTNKYFSSKDDINGVQSDAYVVEFDQNINYYIGDPNVEVIDIKSRRTLLEISKDLQELNNIQRGLFRTKSLRIGSTFYNYERNKNYKFSTDSYAKVLLSDVDTVRELSAVVYIDYKNELAMNITRLEKEYNIPIISTSNYSITGKLMITCQYNHDLRTGDSVVLEFTGGTFSSATVNQQYFGYHNVTVIDPLKFTIELDYEQATGDKGFVKYIRRDPFLNYQPIDLIELGVDKRGKQSIELSIDNLKLSNEIYSLNNVDFNKFRFRLIDGLNLETISLSYPWLLEAEITDAVIGTDGTQLIWYKGTWECGRWFGGTWISGTWMSGDWYDGTWNAKKITDNLISVDVSGNTSDKNLSIWRNGRWHGGTWNDGIWVNGRWYAGTWNNGDWYRGIWNDGTWNSGRFTGGIWVEGTWNGGIMNCDNDPTYWINGTWNAGDFENGMWYNGIFSEKRGDSRFGTKAYNSRTANWQNGKWIAGSFFSRLIEDNDGNPEVSISHKYSIWKTGTFYTGEIWGGIFYNIDFKSGNWYGGILDEIQIIGIRPDINNPINTSITLNGVFNYNIGDKIIINIPDDSVTNLPNYDKYKILYVEKDEINKITNLTIDTRSYSNIQISNPNGLSLRIISLFNSVDWYSGIWTNGIFNSGTWNGGIWYNGLFTEKAKWS